MKQKTTINILFIALIINSGLAIYMVYEYNNYNCKACEMRFDLETGSINGYYRAHDHFCVYTKGRNIYEVAETTYHELAHYYTMTVDTEHFTKEICQ